MNPSETTRARTDEIRPSRRSWRPKWQFSIREVLLLTTAIAALVALAGLYLQRPPSFQESGVAERVSDIAWIRATCVKLGHSLPSTRGQVVEIAERDGRDGRQWRSEFTVAVSPAQRGAFMIALQHELFVIERGFGLGRALGTGEERRTRNG